MILESQATPCLTVFQVYGGPEHTLSFTQPSMHQHLLCAGHHAGVPVPKSSACWDQQR